MYIVILLFNHFLVDYGFGLYISYPSFYGETFDLSRLRWNSSREQLETQRDKADDTLMTCHSTTASTNVESCTVIVIENMLFIYFY